MGTKCNIVMIILLCAIILTVAAPTPNCTEIQQNDPALIDLPTDIVEAMTDTSCDTQLSIGNVAHAEWINGNITYAHPIINATKESFTIESCRDLMDLHISCPNSGFDKRLCWTCNKSPPVPPNTGPAASHANIIVWLDALLTMLLFIL